MQCAVSVWPGSPVPSLPTARQNWVSSQSHVVLVAAARFASSAIPTLCERTVARRQGTAWTPPRTGSLEPTSLISAHSTPAGVRGAESGRIFSQVPRLFSGDTQPESSAAYSHLRCRSLLELRRRMHRDRSFVGEAPPLLASSQNSGAQSGRNPNFPFEVKAT